MATLLEKLKQNLGQVGGTATPQDATGEIQSLLAARRGQVGPAIGLRGRSLTEAAAQQQTQEQLGQAATQATMTQQAIGQAQAEQQTEQAAREAAITGQQAEARLQGRIKTENVLQELERGRAELSEDRRQSSLEQAGALLRLQNKKYIDDLQREGDRARLQDSVRFNEELARAISAENQAMLGDWFKTKAMLDANQRDFEKRMEQMSAADVLAALRDEARFGQTQATIGGISETAKAGLSAFQEKKAADKERKEEERVGFRTIDQSQYSADKYRTT